MEKNLNNQEQKNLFQKKSLFNTNSFITGNNAFATQPIKPVHQKEKLINDFDSALILEKIDKTVKNKAVKINLKINAIEKNIALVKEELDLLELLKLHKDDKKRNDLIAFKTYLEEKLNKLKEERKKFGLYYSVTGFFADKIDVNKIKELTSNFINEVKKYDRIALNYLKSKDYIFKNISLSLFK